MSPVMRSLAGARSSPALLFFHGYVGHGQRGGGPLRLNTCKQTPR